MSEEDSVTQLVHHGFHWGLILSAVLVALFLAVLRINPEIMLNDYPPDVRAKWGPISPKAKRQRTWFSLPFVAAVIGILWLSWRSFAATASTPIGFGTAFLHFAVVMGTFNLVDLVLLDFPLVYFQPRFMILPGTEGMAGYRSYRFHVRGFLIGLVVVTVGAAIAGALAILVR